MRTVLLLVAFGPLISSSVSGVVNRKARSSPLCKPPSIDSLNADAETTPSTSAGVSDQDFPHLYEFFRIIADAMKAQATGNITSELDKYPVWDVIGHILNGTLEIETTTPPPQRRRR